MKMKHFNINEFDSPDLLNSGINMKKEFLSKLVKARQIADIPFIIDSGYRSTNHNRIIGGLADSAHLTGQAADIRCLSSIARYKIISSLLLAGFTRLGVYSNFLHVDSDTKKPQNVIWFDE